MVMKSHRGEKDASTPVCFMCDRAADIKCPGCDEVWFCCPAHGSIHFRQEVGTCFPWRVTEAEGKGRIMVTTRRVRAGETLFMEEPIVHGPNQDGSPICLTCYSAVSLDYLCPGCCYPMCDEECAAHPAHEAECRVLGRGKAPVFTDGFTEAYHCILPLRLLLLARQDPDRASLADHLMDHEEERLESEDWVTTERTVVKNLLEDCGAAKNEAMTVEEVRRAVGVLEVNCYEVYTFLQKTVSSSAGNRGCFPAASLLSHSCVANSRHLWGTEPPYTNTCIATTDIEAGEEVVTSYVHPTTAAIRRRPKLLAGWYFECGCERCGSATEMDTHHNTLVCPACGQPRLLPSRPRDLHSDWVCHCGHSATNKEVLVSLEKLDSGIKTITDNCKYSVDMWLKLLDLALTVVHPQHEIIVQIAKFLIPIMCRGPGQKTEDFPLNLVRRKLELVQSAMNVLNVLDPGYSKARVKALYEMVETKLFLAFRGDADLHQAKLKILIRECFNNISEVICVLERLRPDKGFESMIVLAAETLQTFCQEIENQIDEGELDVERWRRESWYLLDLCTYSH